MAVCYELNWKKLRQKNTLSTIATLLFIFLPSFSVVLKSDSSSRVAVLESFLFLKPSIFVIFLLGGSVVLGVLQGLKLTVVNGKFAT